MDLLPNKESAQQTTLRTTRNSWAGPKNQTTGRGRSSLRPEGLTKEERRSLLTPARLSNRKAWPRRNDACFRPFQLRPASPTGRPGQGGSTLTSDSGPPLRLEGLANSPPTPVLASDSGPPLRPEGLAEEERRSPPTPACLSDWKAWPARLRLPRSLLTPARLSDRKAWPRRNAARFRL